MVAGEALQAAAHRCLFARHLTNHHDIYLQFCGDFNVDPLAPSEDDLALAAVHFAMGHTVNSVKSYMSAIQNLLDMHGAGPLPRGPGFVLACRGLRRLLGPADCVERTRALSAKELKKILRSLDRHKADDVCFGAELVVAFWLALRTEDHTAGRLRWGDVYPQRDGSVEFLLPPGKSVREFRHVAAAGRSDCLDPLTWLQACAHGAGGMPGPSMPGVRFVRQGAGLSALLAAVSRGVHHSPQGGGAYGAGAGPGFLLGLLSPSWRSDSDAGIGVGAVAGHQASCGLGAQFQRDLHLL